MLNPSSHTTPSACTCSLTMALAAGARQYGAQIAMPVTVQGLQQVGDGWRVETSSGVVNARNVVNSAGFWAEEVGRLAGQ